MKNVKAGSPVFAGIIYFAIVFAIAFVLGAIRVIIVVPRVGELLAVILETPIILTISWRTTTWVVRKQQISSGKQHVVDRAIMGLIAFGTLMIAELVLSVVAFGKTSTEFVRDLTSSTPQLIGLIGQILYGLFPLVQGYVHNNEPLRKKGA